MNQTNSRTLVALYAAAFVAAFNENIINVALADIIGAFGITYVTSQWLVTGYMIVTTVMVTLSAFLFRRFSIRKLIFAGAAFLAIGCIGAFASVAFPMLLLFRLVQALGTGIFIPVMMTSVLALAPKQKMGTYLAIGSCCITLGPAVSPVVSGFMASMFGWRYIFVVPCVAIVAIAVAGVFAVRNYASPQKVRLDFASAALASFGLTALVFGFVQITSEIAAAVVSLLLGAAAIAFFVKRQTTLDDPILDIGPFKKSGFPSACVLSLVAMLTTFSMSVVLVLYFEDALGFSAFEAGLLLLVPILVNAAMAVVAGRVMDSKGPWPLVPLGFLAMAIGQCFVAAFASDSRLIEVVAGAVITYAGVGLAMAPSQTAGLSLLREEQHASGVSLVNLFVQVAACLGPALLVGVYSSASNAATAGGFVKGAAEAHGFSTAVWVAAAIAVAGLFLSVWFARRVVRAQVTAGIAPEGRRARWNTLEEMPVSELAKREVFSVDDGATIAQAIDVMLRTESGAIPILDGRRHVVGFLSDGDVIRFLSGNLGQPTSSVDALAQMLVRIDLCNTVPQMLSTKALDLANRNVICADSRDSLGKVLRLLSDSKVKKLPVLEGGVLMGSVSRSDIMRFFLESQRQAAGGSAQ